MKNKFSEIIFKEYLETVEKSGVLETFKPEEFSEDEFKKKLSNCRLVAQKEFISCHDEIVKLFKYVIEIDNDINSDIKIIENKHSTYADNWKGIFDEFNLRLTEIFIYSSEKLIGSFEEKIKRIDNFTICLFGRTKVGKSTTMEALTMGNGETIGIGRQNTTVDVKEYCWNNLKVIDTPGIDAMHEIEKLEELALQFADNSDLIAFLMPHQIEEGDFQKFKIFYQQKKPIIIILNVKESTGELGTKDMEMFLKRSDKIFDDKIQGYKDRINEYIFDTLGIEKGLIPIIPVHSKSAFISNHITDPELRQKLYSISNFPNLESLLINEVTEYGELYRIKNPHETLKLFSGKIIKELNIFSGFLSEQQKIFHANLKKFKVVKQKIKQSEDAIILTTIENFFMNKFSSVGYVVDQLFDTKKELDRKKILNDFINEPELNKRVEKAVAETRAVINKQVKEFFESFSNELNSVNLNSSKSNIMYSTTEKIRDLHETDSRNNIIEGTGVFTGVAGSVVAAISGTGAIGGAAGTIFGLGSANIWNPIGWTLLGVGAVLGVSGIFLSKSKKEKIKENKRKARIELKNELKKIKTNVISGIKKSNGELVEQIKEDHIEVLNTYLKYSVKYQSKINILTKLVQNISSNSEKNKYQAMCDNFTNSYSYKVQEVLHTEKNISIFLKDLPPNLMEIQKVFSRVEEKQILLFKA